MRQINLEDKKLFSILEARGEIFKELGEINKKIVEADGVRTKLAYKMQRLKDKTAGRLKKHKLDLVEFEDINSVGIEDNKITIKIFNQVEEYKKMLREKKSK